MADKSTEESTQPSKIVLHHLENSRSQRVLWLLEELAIPYELRLYKLTAQRGAPLELRDVHPLGKSPVITDGSVTLAESGAIVEYLISTYGGDNMRPRKEGFVDNLYFSHYSEASVLPWLFTHLFFSLIPQHSPALIRPLLKSVFSKVGGRFITPELERHGKLIEAHLAKTKGWIAGGDNLTSADFLMAFTLEVFLLRAPEFTGPHIREYVVRVQERPAYKRALQRGGDYDYLLPKQTT